MSFGFGIGDFLAVIELANKIHKRFSDAPAKLQDISNEAKSISVVLSDVLEHVDTVVKGLDPSKAEELKSIIDDSSLVLKDLEDLLDSMQSLGHVLSRELLTRVSRI